MSNSFYYEGEVEVEPGPEFIISLNGLIIKNNNGFLGPYDVSAALDEIIVERFGYKSKLRILIERVE